MPPHCASGNLGEMDEATRIQICSLVAGVLSSDRQLHEDEAAFLQRMRARFALPKGAAVVPVLDRDEAAAQLGALPEAIRETTMNLLIEAAAIDGAVSAQERAFLGAFAAVVHLDDEELEERLEQHLSARKTQPFGLAAKQEDDV